MLWYTLSVQNIRNTFLILSCTPFCPQNSLNSSGHGLYRVSKMFHRDAGPCWLQLPTVVSSWQGVLWVVDHSWYTWETIEHEKPSSVAVLDTNRCARHLLPYPIQRHLNILSCPFSLWMAHIQYTIHVSIVSWLKNPPLLPFICTDWSGFNKWHQ